MALFPYRIQTDSAVELPAHCFREVFTLTVLTPSVLKDSPALELKYLDE